MQTLIGSQFPKVVIPLINQATRSLHIIVYDWRWYPNDPGNPVQLFNQAIVRAVRRGVSVKVITNIEDVIEFLTGVGCQAVKPPVKNSIHSKMMIIDERDLVIGSHNYTQSAFTTNYEISVFIPNSENVDLLLTFFNNLYNYHG